MSEITMDSLSIDKVSQKLFFTKNLPSKPMVAVAGFNFLDLFYRYQVDIGIYLPVEITNPGLKIWENKLCISECFKPDVSKSPYIDSAYRQITIEFDASVCNILGTIYSLLDTDTMTTLKYNLYTIQLNYHTNSFEKDSAKSIFVNYTFDDPETTRGTVTTVRDISETQTS